MAFLRRSCQFVNRPPLWSSGQGSWPQSGDVLCFLWGTNWIYICYVEESRSPLWSSVQSFWLQFQRSGFDSRRYKIFWEAVGLERGALSLVSTIEELLGRKSSGSSLEIWEYDRRDSSCWQIGTLYPQKFSLTSPTNGGHSVGIVRPRTEAKKFFLENFCKQDVMARTNPLLFYHAARTHTTRCMYSLPRERVRWDIVQQR
jgi:hypothetical protein